MILVTGATGFIGRWLMPALRARGWNVIGHAHADGDITGPLPDYKGVGKVIHLAARSFVPDSWRDPRSYYETNVLGTVSVLEYCRRTGASLVYVSSYVYGPPQFLPVTEEHPLNATNPYAYTKIAAEGICRFYSEHFGIGLCIVRPFNLYGEGQDSRFLIPHLIRQVVSEESQVIEVADDRPRRDYLHVSDFVELLIAALDRGSGVYNAGSGSSASVREIAGMINHLTCRAKPLVSKEQCRPGEIPDVIADIGRAKRELNWQPRTSLEAGLEQMLAVERRTVPA